MTIASLLFALYDLALFCVTFSNDPIDVGLESQYLVFDTVFRGRIQKQRAMAEENHWKSSESFPP